MGVEPFVFESAGQRSEHFIPGCYSRSVAVGGGGGSLSAGNLAILGKAKSGAPCVLNVFSDADEAKEVLGGGELLKAVGCAFNASTVYRPQRVFAMVVNKNSRSSRILKSGGEGAVKIESAECGAGANMLRMQISEGTKAGTHKVFAAKGDRKATADNIGLSCLSVQYVGAGASATLSIDGEKLKIESESAAVKATGTVSASGEATDEGVLTAVFFQPGALSDVSVEVDVAVGVMGDAALELLKAAINATAECPAEALEISGGVLTLRAKEAGSAGNLMTVSMTAIGTGLTVSGGAFSGGSDGSDDNVELPFASFATVGSLVDALNAKGTYAAEVLDGGGDFPSADLDLVAGTDAKSTAAVAKADFNALISALNAIDLFGSVEVLKKGAMPENDAEEVYFSGAGEGSYTAEDWAEALSVLETENIQIVATPSADPAVHFLIKNHCIEMSNVVNRKERTFFVGGAAGETLDAACDAAKEMNTHLGSYCYNGIVARDAFTGEKETLPASYFAVMCAALESALAINEPLTNKGVDVSAFAKKLKVPEIERLIAAGVLVGGENDDGDMIVVRAMTTWQGNQIQLCERSMVREDLYMNRDIRSRYQATVGHPDLTGGGDIVPILRSAALDWESAGLIFAGKNGLVWDVRLKVKGDKTWLVFSRNLMAVRNFVGVTAKNFVNESEVEMNL